MKVKSNNERLSIALKKKLKKKKIVSKKKQEEKRLCQFYQISG